MNLWIGSCTIYMYIWQEIRLIVCKTVTTSLVLS